MTHAFSAEDLSGHADFLQRMARALLGDPELARDAAQDALVTALEHPPREAGNVRPWLSTVLRNQTRNRHRREVRRVEREHDVARAEPIEGGQDIVERIELQRLVCEAVLALDGPKRDAIFLRYYDGLTPSAIAERQGESLKTVKSRLNRALEELRERLDAQNRGDRRAWAAVLLPLARDGRAAPTAASFAASLPFIAAGAAVVLAFVVWRNVARPVEPAPVAPPSVATTTSATNAVAPATSSARTPSAPSEALTASTGALEVHLRWESDGAVAAGIGIDAWAANDPAPREIRQRATSDALGVARFDALVPGPVELRLDRTATFAGEAVAGETRTLELVVPTGYDIVGRVVTESGTPVGGAELWIENTLARLPDPWPVGRSAEDGSFRLRGLSLRERLVARSASHVTTSCLPLYQLQPDANGQRSAELVLSEGGEPFAGRVLAADGSAVADAVVWIRASQFGSNVSASGKIVEPPGSARVTTDAEGRFTAPSRFPEGDHDLIVIAPGFACWHGDFEVVAGEPATIEVRLPPAVTIAGTVHDKMGAPVAGARVTAKSTAGQSMTMRGRTTYVETFLLPALRATTDASGGFSLGWASGRSYVLAAEIPGRPELGRMRTFFEPTEHVAVDLQIDPDPRITGRVVDASGRPLVGWFVQAVTEPMGGELLDTHTDSAGAFAFYGVEEDAYRIVAMASTKGVQPTVETRAKAGDIGLELVLTGPSTLDASLRGQFLAADGRPVTDARLIAQSLRTGNGVVLSPDARTGRFEFGPVEAGLYRLKAMRDQRVVALGEPIELAPGTTTDCGMFTVAATGSLVVRVSGATEGSAWPHLERPGFGTVPLIAEGDAFTASELAPGSWWLRTGGSELFAPDREVVIGSGERTELEVAVEPGTGFTLRIDREDSGFSKSGLVLEIHDGAGKLLVHSIQDIGVRITGDLRFVLPRGPITLDAWTEDGRRGRAASNVGEELQQPFVFAVR